MLRIVSILAIAVLASWACGGDGNSDTRVTGLLVDVRVSSAGELERIAVQTEDGERRDFAIELDPGAEVSAEHLRLHMAQDWPVSVAFRDSRDGPVAYRIDDAGTPPTDD